LNDRELGRRLGARARETVVGRFTPRHQSVAVAKLYTNLIARQRA
jgi:hypothetical protein